MNMPSGTSWASVRIPDSQNMHVAQSDVKDYFYSLGIPSELGRYFSLPPVRAGAAQQWCPAKKFTAGLI